MSAYDKAQIYVMRKQEEEQQRAAARGEELGCEEEKSVSKGDQQQAPHKKSRVCVFGEGRKFWGTWDPTWSERVVLFCFALRVGVE